MPRSAAAGTPHILHLVVDDLGYNDLGYKNGVVDTPNLDKLATGGVQLTDYYTFTVCAPSRASIMTGRYAWAIGYYWVGGDEEAVDVRFKMLPALLKQQGYETVAIGKWHCGAILKEHTPTYRGFDAYYGYYHAATANYWYHGGEGGGCQATDFSNNTGTTIAGAEGQNGTYSTHAYTDYAVARIQRHDASTPLYMYFAHQATHAASAGGIQAPLSTVERYPLIADDTLKVQAAATTELDWSVGNVTAALTTAGMWPNTVVVCVSDNGGPLQHTINYPLRGGKHEYWEGGIRGEAFVYSELLPQSVRGSKWPGLAHTSDWYVTFVEGLAGLPIPADTGPTPVDGFNLWPALSSGGASPRTEMIMQVQNDYSKGHGLEASIIRQGDYKLVIGDPGGDDRVVAYPALADAPVPFGNSDGTVEKGTDHANGPGRGGANKNTNCAKAPCLFDVRNDVSESKDLGGDKQYAALIANMTRRVTDEAKRGMPFAETFGDGNNKRKKAAKAAQCNIATQYGFVEPADCGCGPNPPPPGPSPPGPSPPGPPGPSPPLPPPPANCEAACVAACPRSTYPDYDSCLKCTRDTKSVTDVCKPKARHAYCNQTLTQ